MADNSVTIKIKGDSKDYKATIGDVTKETKTFTQNVSGMSRSVVSATGVAVAAFASITYGVKKLIDAYAIQEQAEIRTAQIIKATGYAAGITTKEVLDLASSLQKATTFGDETILTGTSLLLTFKNIGAETFPRATKAMLDMATTMGGDLKGAAIQLGKALNDPVLGIQALNRVGVQFTDEQKNQISAMQKAGDIGKAQALILKEIETQMGGTARAAAHGTGIWKQLGNVLGDIAEKVGGKAQEKLGLYGRMFRDLAVLVNKSMSPKSVKELSIELDALILKLKDAQANSFFKGRDISTYKRDIEELKKQLSEAKSIEDKDRLDKEEANRVHLAKINEDKKAAKQRSMEIELAKGQAELDTGAASTEGDAVKLKQLELQIENERILKEDARVAELEAEGKHAEALALIKENSSNRQLDITKRKVEDNKKLKEQELKNEKDFFALAITLQNSNNKAMAAIGKSFALYQIALKTPEAVANAYTFGSKGGPVLGAVFAGIAAAAMAQQAAQVVGLSGFESGGVIGGFQGATVGSDNRLAKVRDGEMMLNASQQKNLFDAIDSGAINQGGSNLEVSLSLKDGLIDFVEAQIIERRAIGISRI